MKTFQLLHDLQFNDKNALATPLLVSDTGRILRFTLRPGQQIKQHKAPHSPVYIVVLKGRGGFSAADGVEQEFGPQALLTFEPGEEHAVRALDEDLVFVAILHGAHH